jgi:threonine aldolase
MVSSKTVICGTILKTACREEVRMKKIDLRRDTITLPDKAMRDEAFNAILGDSVYGEDPGQEELEQLAAKLLGKDGAIFVPSGTMGNLVALLSHTKRGDEIIVEENAHIRTSETGGAACVGGLMIRTVRGEDGAPEPEGVKASIRPVDIHYPGTGLICLESTHYRYGGIVPPLEKFSRIHEIANRHRVPVHLDGARLFNASLFLEVDVKEIAQHADSVMVSLSKGLGAPVVSGLCSSRDFIVRARRFRKMLGGGMRQTGWLCACGLVALSEKNISRLKADHDNAQQLARGLTNLPGVGVDIRRTQTNYVLATLDTAQIDVHRFVEMLADDGILVAASGEDTVRFVTSREVTGRDIGIVLDRIKELLN